MAFKRSGVRIPLAPPSIKKQITDRFINERARSRPGSFVPCAWDNNSGDPSGTIFLLPASLSLQRSPKLSTLWIYAIIPLDCMKAVFLLMRKQSFPRNLKSGREREKGKWWESRHHFLIIRPVGEIIGRLFFFPWGKSLPGRGGKNVTEGIPFHC